MAHLDAPVRLRLLDATTWDRAPIPGGRTVALLAALVGAAGRPVGENALVERVWGDASPPANPGKALQVVVSRARSQTDAAVVVRSGAGYRLGLGGEDVDALVLAEELSQASRAEAHGDAVAARDHARAAREVVVTGSGEGPLGELRDLARSQRAEAGAVLGRALSVLGDHGEALGLLEAASGDDEASQTALLRSLSAVSGAPAALERYEALRAELADRLGVDPGPRLQAVHAELLAADHPVRSGLRYDASSLIGRDDDLRALRALVREARVVSILGPGGLGKTRLAHLLGQQAEQSVVHFVELVGVADPDDVVGEVGSVLGVRDSVSGRRALAPEQRRDVRARIAQNLARAPTLLILDNAEHVVDAVADLVAYLVASDPRLRVVTTTRAPLQIAAERVYALGQLDEDAAVELFVQRARNARPAVALDTGPEGAVRRVVRRLDGLPLAIELAAAKVRAMSVEDVDRRLDDRFTLLRGGDRAAPDRHQTLVAVIDWSWNLLTEEQRRALRWLSVFHDGFTLAGAEALLARDSIDDVQALVDQSLLTVLDDGASVRYRMLETVREFGRMQLVGAGEEESARAARQRWAGDYADRAARLLWSPQQIEGVGAMLVEENNLSECLRVALAAADPPMVARLVDALATFWTVTGENLRVIALTGDVDAAFTGWDPPAELVDVAVRAASMTAMNAVTDKAVETPACVRLMASLGERAHARIGGLASVLLAEDPTDPEASLRRLDELADRLDAENAVFARTWSAHHLENAGDPRASMRQAELGLARLEASPDPHGPWLGALLHTLIAALHAQLGDDAEVAAHARAALPVLDRLQAVDDAVQIRALLVYDALRRDRLADAEALVRQIEERDPARLTFAGAFVLGGVRAEVAFARGAIEEGLRHYRAAIAGAMRTTFAQFPEQDGLEPWVVAVEALALTAYAVHERADGRDLFDVVRAKAPRILASDRQRLDYPIAGLVLHALGAWGLLVEPDRPEAAVRLLALAESFAYPRMTPSLAPARTDAAADRLAPGVLAQTRAELGERRGAALLDLARDALAQLPA